MNVIRRARMSTLIGIIAIVLFVWSAAEFNPLTRPEPPFEVPFVLLIGGAVALGVAMVMMRRSSGLPRVTMPRDVPLTPDRMNRRWTLIGIVVLACAAEVSAGGLHLIFLKEVSTHIQFALWSAGVALVGYGMAGAPPLKIPRYDSRHLAVLAAVVIFAFAVRVIGLGESIWQMIDELHWMEGVSMIRWERDAYDLLRSPSSFQAVTAVYTYWNAGTVAVFGTNLFGLRFLDAVIGTLTVLAMYGLGRAMFDRRMGVIAALVLATFPPHVQFSRVALAHITDGFVAVALIMFVVRGMRWGRRVDWAAAGVTLGMSQYFFETGRLLFPVLTLAWFAAMLALTPKAQKHWRGMVIVVVTAAILALPVYYNIAVRGENAIARLSHSSSLQTEWLPLFQDGIQAGDLEQAAEWLVIPFRFYVNAREAFDFYGGRFGLLHPVVIPLFFMGVFYCLWRARSPLNIFPLFVVLTGIGSAFLVNKWGSPRYIIVMPVLALMIAVGIRYGLALVVSAEKVWKFKRDHVWMALAVCVTIFHGVYYVGDHLPYFNNRLLLSRPYPDMFDGAQRAARDYDRRTTQVFFVSTYQADANLARGYYDFLVGDHPYRVETLPLDQFNQAMLDLLPRDRNYLFMIEPGLNEVSNLLYANFAQVYPPTPPERILPASKEFWAYFVPMANPNP